MNNEQCSPVPCNANQYDLDRLAQKLIEIEGFETLGDQTSRLKSIVDAVGCALSAGLDAGFRAILPGTTRPPYAGDAIAYIKLPLLPEQSVLAHPVPEYKEISYFLPKAPDYTGYDRKEKLARVAEFVKQREQSQY